jgi:hypothetical protein
MKAKIFSLILACLMLTPFNLMAQTDDAPKITIDLLEQAPRVKFSVVQNCGASHCSCNWTLSQAGEGTPFVYFAMQSCKVHTSWDILSASYRVRFDNTDHFAFVDDEIPMYAAPHFPMVLQQNCVDGSHWCDVTSLDPELMGTLISEIRLAIKEQKKPTHDEYIWKANLIRLWILQAYWPNHAGLNDIRNSLQIEIKSDYERRIKRRISDIIKTRASLVGARQPK